MVRRTIRKVVAWGNQPPTFSFMVKLYLISLLLIWLMYKLG